MHGILSIGDGIATGRGRPMRGVHCQGWPQWLSDAMGGCILSLARGGASSTTVVDEQLPKIQGDFLIGTITMGTNDVLGGDDGRFAANLRRTVDALLLHCETVALVTLTSGVGGAARREHATSVNASILAEAGDSVFVIDIGDLGGPTMLHGDLVHPTALGQLEIADRAAAALAQRVTLPAPSSLVVKRRIERRHAVTYPLQRLRAARRPLGSNTGHWS